MKFYSFLFFLVSLVACKMPQTALNNMQADNSPVPSLDGMSLVWQEEFDKEGKPDSTVWQYENGFVRNHELQWYQPDNAYCKGGVLHIDARRTHLPNPNFVANSPNWKKNRSHITFTSASINTRGKKEWQFGTFIIRAKIDTTMGAWPAIWTLGVKEPWPANGEIDIMEFYRTKTGDPIILGNFAWGTGKPNVAKWDDRGRLRRVRGGAGRPAAPARLRAPHRRALHRGHPPGSRGVPVRGGGRGGGRLSSPDLRCCGKSWGHSRPASP